MKLSKRRQQPDDEEVELSGGEIITHPSVASMTFEKALEAFLQAQDAAFHSRETSRDYRMVVGLFVRYMVGEHHYTAIQQVQEVDILGWLAHLRNSLNVHGRAYSSRSVETYCRDVLVFFRWLFQHKHLAVNPAAQVKMPKVEKPLIRVFTDDELKRLDTACDRGGGKSAVTEDERKALAARDRAVLWLLLSTGIRISELCGLLFRDIDWETGMIYVRGKGAKERRVPIGKVARQHLRTYVQYWRGVANERDEHVFLNLWGRPMAKTNAHQIFERLKRVSGITDKRVSAHTCRHWFAVNCIKRGMPSTVLQGLLGHERLEQINTYVRLAEQDNREIYAQYSPVDALDMHHSVKGRREQLRDWRTGRKRQGRSQADGSAD